MIKESRTAIGAAMLRAAHQLIDGEARIFEDPVILKILEPVQLEYIRQHPAEYALERWRSLRSHIVLRSRYAEDCLREAVDRGVRQYIILGAGLDTFAYRQGDWARDLRILEADHPASQSFKLHKLEQAGLGPRENQVFVTVDLDKDNLEDVFTGGGGRKGGIESRPVLRPGEPVFVSWLGVMVYLRWETIDAVFRFVAGLPKGSEFVFTFSPKRWLGWPDPVAFMARAAGEPWISFIDPPELSDKLKKAGFASVHFLEPEEARQLYYMDATIQLPVPKKSSIVRAMV
jgi:methyltransferase (TIGR00027 family)